MVPNLFLLPYFLLGVAFVVIASLTARTRGPRGFVLATLTAVVILLVVGVLQERATDPDGETAMGFPILLGVLAPTLTGVTVWQLGKHQVARGIQWTLGLIAWGLGFLATEVAAVFLNWVTF